MSRPSLPETFLSLCSATWRPPSSSVSCYALNLRRHLIIRFLCLSEGLFDISRGGAPAIEGPALPCAVGPLRSRNGLPLSLFIWTLSLADLTVAIGQVDSHNPFSFSYHYHLLPPTRLAVAFIHLSSPCLPGTRLLTQSEPRAVARTPLRLML